MKKKIFTSAKLLLIGVILLCNLVFTACSALALEFEERDLSITNLDGKTIPIKVELARSIREMSKGYMGRENIPEGTGMLFIFKRERKPRMEKSGRSPLSIEEYRSLYFHPVRSQMRTAFSINLETLQNLRNVLQDLGERVSIASYIDNILREHLREHQELLNNAAAKQRRKTTITL